MLGGEYMVSCTCMCGCTKLTPARYKICAECWVQYHNRPEALRPSGK